MDIEKIKNINLGCISEFPFLDYTFDSITEWEILQKLAAKTNEVIKFVNDNIENQLNTYIQKRFNDIVLNSLYEEPTETLILQLENRGA